MFKAIIFDLIGVLISVSPEEERENRKLVEKLKENYKLAILSNASLREVREIGKMSEYFDAVVLSSETGFGKPKKEAYEITLSKIGATPKETIFIDDTHENIEGAKKAEIEAVLYRGTKQLKKDLKERGIRL